MSTDSPDFKMSLKKGETFSTPTSAPSSDRDPVLNFRSLPVRSPTSLEAIASILDSLTLDSTDDKSPAAGDDSNSKSMHSPSTSNEESRSLPIPLDETKTRQEHSQDSDSGLGTSVSSEEGLAESSTKGT
jgi:hypothetical protein